MFSLIGVVAIAGIVAIILYLKDIYSEDLRATKIHETSENKTKKGQKIEKVRKEIARIMDKDPDEILQITDFFPGKHVYEFTVGTQKFIMKENNKKSKATRKKEIVELVKLISENKLGPKFIGSSEDYNLYIMSFEGHEMTMEAVRDGTVLREIGAKLRKTHDLTGNFPNKQTGLQMAKKHYQSIIRKRIAIQHGLEEAFRRYEQETKDLTPEQNGFCHANLSPSNVMKLDGNNVIFTGWANAGVGDQFEDLGYFIASTKLNAEQIRIFMIGYLSGTEPSIEVFNKLEKYINRAVFLIVLEILDGKREDIKKYDKKKLEKVIAEPTVENLAAVMNISK
jgi:thiamine kinase-like enzyme